MKKYILILFVIFASLVSFDVMAQNENRVYVYHDNVTDVFPITSIDSITYVVEDGIMSQVLWTKTNVYKNPVNLVDSIGFETPYNFLNGEIKSFSNVSAKYFNDGVEKIKFQNIVKVSINSLDGISECGVYLYNPETAQKYYYYPINGNSLEDDINIDLDINKADFDEIIYGEYYARKGVYIGLYSRMKMPDGKVSYFQREPQKYDLVYNVKPIVTTGEAIDIKETSASVEGTYENYKFWNGIAGMQYGFNGTFESLVSDFAQEGKSVFEITGLKLGETYSYQAFIEVNGERMLGETRQFTTTKKEEGPTEGTWIDLGLPSGIKWASCNVEAICPEDFGGYYAWGEIEQKYDYTDENSETFNKKMDDFSGNDKYDVARAKLGAPARTPTISEFEELIKECTWKWFNYNGVDGQLVTGPNGNSIFLPVAGYCYGTKAYFVGQEGYYWSSTPYQGEDGGACAIHFNNNGVMYNWSYRGDGQNVRPVSD